MSATIPADPNWVRKFRYRLDDFEASTRRQGVACSFKWRTVRGRFDRGSSPAAYRMIDAFARNSGEGDRWVEVHSNGPELLVYLSPEPTALAIASPHVALLGAMAHARAEGIRQGDTANDPLELIVRRFDERGRYVEGVLLELEPGMDCTVADLRAALLRGGIVARS
jgi:hypothetical protein